jgi:hypothetical protein
MKFLFKLVDNYSFELFFSGQGVFLVS